MKSTSVERIDAERPNNPINEFHFLKGYHTVRETSFERERER